MTKQKGKKQREMCPLMLASNNEGPHQISRKQAGPSHEQAFFYQEPGIKILLIQGEKVKVKAARCSVHGEKQNECFNFNAKTETDLVDPET